MSKESGSKTIIIIILAIVLATAGLIASIISSGFVLPDEEEKVTDTSSENQSSNSSELGAAGENSATFKVEDIKEGTGALAEVGKSIKVHYTGTLTDGTKFDSSVDRGQPFIFTLGKGEVIEGWDKGFEGMKVGGKRKLTIPASMGYGDTENGSIPANSTLLFDVELLEVSETGSK